MMSVTMSIQYQFILASCNDAVSNFMYTEMLLVCRLLLTLLFRLHVLYLLVLSLTALYIALKVN